VPGEEGDDEVVNKVSVAADGSSDYYSGQGTEIDDAVDELADSLSKITDEDEI
jgi:hypothetical protein